MVSHTGCVHRHLSWSILDVTSYLPNKWVHIFPVSVWILNTDLKHALNECNWTRCPNVRYSLSFSQSGSVWWCTTVQPTLMTFFTNSSASSTICLVPAKIPAKALCDSDSDRHLFLTDGWNKTKKYINVLMCNVLKFCKIFKNGSVHCGPVAVIFFNLLKKQYCIHAKSVKIGNYIIQ